MTFVDRFGQAFRKGADLQIYGGGGRSSSSARQRIHLSGSHFDYAAAAGPLYDNGVVLPTVNWKARAISEARLRIQKQDGEGNWAFVGSRERIAPNVNAADVLRAFDDPNDYYDGTVLWQGVQLSDDVRGNAYLYVRTGNNELPIGFYWIFHERIRPMADRDNSDGRKLVTHYEYRPWQGAPQEKERDEIVHFRQGIDPLDPACGLSPLAAELRDICLDNEVSTWLASILRNGATPGVIFSPKSGVSPGEATPAQRQRLVDKWKTFVGDKRGEPFDTPYPVDITIPTWSPQQMELGKLRDVPMVRIMAGLGVDPMALGFSSEKQTFSNKEQAIDDAGKRTIVPTIQRWARQATRQTFKLWKIDADVYRLWWDTSGVSWLADDKLARNQGVREDYKAQIIDRYTALAESGRPATEADKGVYFTPGKGDTGDPEKDAERDRANKKSFSVDLDLIAQVVEEVAAQKAGGFR